MILHKLDILNYKNIPEASLCLSDKLNCLIGLNGQGKTNVLDAIYMLSFTKSAIAVVDSQCIRNDADIAMVQGTYLSEKGEEDFLVSCGLKRGLKKQFRLGKKDYKRLQDHIGLIPLVMVSPEDSALVEDGSDERRRYMDIVLSQEDRTYLDTLSQYNALLKQRNALLKQQGEEGGNPENDAILEVYELQMAPLAQYIYEARCRFIDSLQPIFQDIHQHISGGEEKVQLRYVSQLQDRCLSEAYVRTRNRDRILGWTSQGIHKDELEMSIRLESSKGTASDLPLKRIGSQGQQKTFLIAMKLAQAVYLSQCTTNDKTCKQKPILLLDDIFDKLDTERVERILHLIQSEIYGQIFLTDTDRQHLTQLLQTDKKAKIFHVQHGKIEELRA